MKKYSIFLILIIVSNITAADQNNKITPIQTLFAATYNHDLRNTKRALEDKPSIINSKNDAGETPLTAAAHEHSFAIMAYLLEHGANPNMKNKKGETPLYILFVTAQPSRKTSTTNGLTKAAELLIKKGARINDPGETTYQNTVLHELAAQLLNRNYPHTAAIKEQIQFLVDNDANINQRNIRGETPLTHALVQLIDQDEAESETFSLFGLEFLLRQSANPAMKTKKGESAIDIIKRSGLSPELKEDALALFDNYNGN